VTDTILNTCTTKFPSIFSEEIAQEYSKLLTKEIKKKNGQFFTPVEIAIFMAELVDVNFSKKHIRILDPGCGTLILSCVLVEKLIQQNNQIERIEIDAYDTDSQLTSEIRKVSDLLIEWGIERRVEIIINFYNLDFLIANESSIKGDNHSANFDIIISNPPYFKVGKDDKRLSIFNTRLHGQQNIYSLFLLGAAKLLNENGQLIFIVPRSFTSGQYFQSFREAFFNKITIESFHLFGSRSEGFNKDKVLQENVIIKAISKNETQSNNVKISASKSIIDIRESKETQYSIDKIITNLGQGNVIHLPINSSEEIAMRIFSSWTHNLGSFGMKASTGPVVPFRCKSYLKKKKSKNTDCVPLLWMHNCLTMKLYWPFKKADKAAWILDNSKSNSKTLKNQNYIILRRFSSKDDKSKLVAAPHLAENLGFSRIGIENHLNYLYKPSGSLDSIEVYGLSVLYNSSLFDAYFRSLSGNTQVSATELNSMPLPPMEIIKKIGKQYLELNGNGINEIDNIVNKNLSLNITSALWKK
jgi:adenine-specific DNA-methyltransferase